MLISQLSRYVASKVANGRPEFNPACNIQRLDWPQQHAAPNAKLSVIIPTRDKVSLLKACVDSLREKADFSSIELIIVDNGSVNNETHSYFAELLSQDIRVLRFPGAFNFSAICNLAARESSGDFLCFLNNDALILNSQTLPLLVGRATEPNSGVVGPVVLESQSIIQEFGLAFGFKGIAGSLYSKSDLQDEKISTLLSSDHEVSAISFSCAVVRKKTFESLGGLDENFAVGLNDVDFCYRAKLAGFKNVVVSSARVLHKGYGTRSRMTSLRGAVKAIKEVFKFLAKHPNFKFKDSVLISAQV